MMKKGNLSLANTLMLCKENLPKEAEIIIYSFGNQYLFKRDKKIAFTMTETITVLVILGIIAVVTIPSLLKNYRLSIYRTKVKKAMEVYMQVINNIATDSGAFRETAQLNTWSNTPTDCARSRKYFRIIRNGDSDCRFRTPDGIWWDITNITNPAISLKGEITGDNRPIILQKAKNINSDKTSFVMTARLDEIASLQDFKGIRGGIRINDQDYEHRLCGNTDADIANREYLAKLYEFIYRDKYEEIANNNPNIANCPNPTPDPTTPDPTTPDPTTPDPTTPDPTTPDPTTPDPTTPDPTVPTPSPTPGPVPGDDDDDDDDNPTPTPTVQILDDIMSHIGIGWIDSDGSFGYTCWDCECELPVCDVGDQTHGPTYMGDHGDYDTAMEILRQEIGQEIIDWIQSGKAIHFRDTSDDHED